MNDEILHSSTDSARSTTAHCQCVHENVEGAYFREGMANQKKNNFMETYEQQIICFIVRNDLKLE